MGGRTTSRTLPPKGHLRLGLVTSPRCERCLEKEESATHILFDCQATACLRLRHLGYYFMQPSYHHDAALRRVLRFIKSVGLTKVTQERGAQ
jgi:hypothetical protein